MKALRIISLVVILLLTMVIGSAWSQVSLPTLNFSGNTETTGTSFSLVTAYVSQANYIDGTSTVLNNAVESIIYMPVTLTATRTGPLSFSDAVITVGDGAFIYFTATLSNITFTTGGACGSNYCLNLDLNASDISTLNLSNVITSQDNATNPSKFILELESKLAANTPIGMKIILTGLTGTMEGTSSSDIFEGLIDGVPDGGGVDPPNGARTIGYWKNHDPERNQELLEAVGFSNVFNDADPDNGDLYLALIKKGKKSMLQKAEQQFAALLLNCASALNTATVLDSGELEILQLINAAYDATATVGDAKSEIENVILLMDDANMENAKDLADEINNRDHRN